MCGSGLGAFIFNPFSKFLIDEYGWRGAILIEAGIILNCVLCGALFRPLEGPKKSSSDTEKNSNKSHLIRDAIEMELKVTGSNPADSSATDSPSIIVSQPSSPTQEPPQLFSNRLIPKDAEYAPFLHKSDGALHLTNRKPLPISPLALDARPRPPHLQRLLSEDSAHHSKHHGRHHLTPGSVIFS